MTKDKHSQTASLLDYLQELVLELAHQIRTPLGVVANDLAYLQCALGHSDLERPLRKTREISDQLSSLRDTLLLGPTEDIRLFCKSAASDPSLLKRDNLLSEALVRQSKYLGERFKEISIRYVSEGMCFGISCFARSSLHAWICPLVSENYSSLYAWSKHGRDSRRFDLVLIDAAVLAHDGRIEVIPGTDELSILWWFDEM